jgi:hypothetical protein
VVNPGQTKRECVVFVVLAKTFGRGNLFMHWMEKRRVRFPPEGIWRSLKPCNPKHWSLIHFSCLRLHSYKRTRCKNTIHSSRAGTIKKTERTLF